MKTSIEPMKRIALAFFVIISSISATAQDAEIKQAERFLDKDQPSKALEVLNQAITTYPEVTKLYYYLGCVQLKTGEQGKALKTFEKGASLSEKDAMNQVGLGAIRMLEKKSTEAKAFFDKALTISKSKDAEVLNAIAEAYLVDAKYSETALKLLEKSKALNPNNPKTFMLMGEADLLQNKGGPAISNSERAIRLDPTNAKPYYSIASVYMRSQNYTLAEENFQKAVTIDPEYTLAYKELGELYYSMKDGVKAATAYESYLKLKENPTDQDKTRYAFFLFMAKNYTKANETFKPLAAKPDASPTTIKYYGYSLVKAENLAEAQKMFDRYYGMIPQDKIEASDYNYYGELLQSLKKDSLAIINYKKSLALNQDQDDIAQQIAEMQFKLKKYPEAIAAYMELFKIRKKPLSKDYYLLGQAYYNTNQFEKADTIFQKFAELQPKITAGYLWVGRTNANLDPDAKGDVAKIAYEKVIEIASSNPETNGNKKELIEAYNYMGSYYGGHRDNLGQVKIYMEKILVLDPTNAKAIEVIKLLKGN
jgi:tetratricopeptide (TPR) repeat protein